VDANVDVGRLVDAGEQVVAIGYTQGTARAASKRFDVPVVHVRTVQAGRVIRFEAYIDNPTILAALSA
jgi:ketosteroid isomerase-like protein